MNRPGDAILGLAFVIVALGATAFGVESCGKGKASNATDSAHVYEGQANAHADEARKKDAQIDALQTARDKAERDVAGVREEVGRLRSALASKVVPAPAGPGEPLPVPVVPDDRDDLLMAQGLLITKQDALIVVLKDENGALVVARDQWKSAFENERNRALAQEVATKAWKDAVTASKWRGRIEGFAAGAALGYVGGRLK